MNSSRILANSVLVFVTFVWGATFTLTKAALVVMPVFPYLTIRFLLATAAMSLFFVRGHDQRQGFGLEEKRLMGIVKSKETSPRKRKLSSWDLQKILGYSV